MATYKKDHVLSYGSPENFAKSMRAWKLYESDGDFHTAKTPEEELSIVTSPYVQNPRLVWQAGDDERLNNVDATIELQNALREENLDAAREAIARGANVNYTDDPTYGITLLHHAALRGNCDFIKLLVEHGADVNAQMVTYKTALHFAVEGKSPQALVALLSGGASVFPRDRDGESALDYAKRCKNDHPMLYAILDHAYQKQSENSEPMPIAASNIEPAPQDVSIGDSRSFLGISWMSLLSALFSRKQPVLQVDLNNDGQFSDGIIRAVHFRITEQKERRTSQSANKAAQEEEATLQSFDPIVRDVLQDVVGRRKRLQMMEQLKEQCSHALEKVIPGAGKLTGYSVTVDQESDATDPKSTVEEKRGNWSDCSILAFPFGLPSLGLELTAIIGVLAIEMRDGRRQMIRICESADAVSKSARVVMKKTQPTAIDR